MRGIIKYLFSPTGRLLLTNKRILQKLMCGIRLLPVKFPGITMFSITLSWRPIVMVEWPFHYSVWHEECEDILQGWGSGFLDVYMLRIRDQYEVQSSAQVQTPGNLF